MLWKVASLNSNSDAFSCIIISAREQRAWSLNSSVLLTFHHSRCCIIITKTFSGRYQIYKGN